MDCLIPRKSLVFVKQLYKNSGIDSSLYVFSLGPV